jgi:hypothetical protein
MAFIFTVGCHFYLEAGEVPKPSSLPNQEVAEPFTEAKRKTIFQEVIEAEKRGMAAADRQYPNDMEHNIALKQQLTTKYRRDVLKKYGLAENSKEWHLIAEEGVGKGWVRKEKKP